MIDALFRYRTDRTLIQLFRYTFVGGFAFVVDFGALLVATELFHIHYLVSAAIAFVLGLVTNYLLSITWVFNSRSLENKWNERFLFALIGLVGLGFNELLIWVFTERLLFHYASSKIIAAVFIFLWNFFARKLTLFR